MDASRVASEFLKFWHGGSTAVLYPACGCRLDASPLLALMVIREVGAHLGLDKTLDAVADPDTDSHGKALEASRRPTRAGKPRKVNDYDF
jgi:hypothetical protein